jgi:putative transposase
MPRRSRISLPNVPQHIIQRGNNRAVCFYAESPDRTIYRQFSSITTGDKNIPINILLSYLPEAHFPS